MSNRRAGTWARRVIFAFIGVFVIAATAHAMSREEFQVCRKAAEKLALPDTNMQSTRCLIQAFIDLKNKNEAYLASLPASSLPVTSGIWVDGNGHTNRVQDARIVGIFMPQASDGLDYDVDFSSATIPTVRISDSRHHISFSYDLRENTGTYMDAQIPLTLSSSASARGTTVLVDGNGLIAAINKIYQQLPGSITMAHFAGKILQDPKVRDTLLEVAAKMMATRTH